MKSVSGRMLAMNFTTNHGKGGSYEQDWIIFSGRCYQGTSQRGCEYNTESLAKSHGISAAYVNDVLQGHRMPGPTVLKALGFNFLELYAKSNLEKDTP